MSIAKTVSGSRDVMVLTSLYTKLTMAIPVMTARKRSATIVFVDNMVIL